MPNYLIPTTNKTNGTKIFNKFGISTLGIRAIKDELHPLGKMTGKKNSNTSSTKSFPIKYQNLRIKSKVKPSGPRDLSVPHSHNTLLISSGVTSYSKMETWSPFNWEGNSTSNRIREAPSGENWEATWFRKWWTKESIHTPLKRTSRIANWWLLI